TRSRVGPFDQAAPADYGAGEADEAVVDIESAFPAHGEAAELTQRGEGLFDDVAQFAAAFDARGFGYRDDGLGAAIRAGLLEGVAAVSLVGQPHGEAAPGPPQPVRDRWVAVKQVDRAADAGHVRAAWSPRRLGVPLPSQIR